MYKEEHKDYNNAFNEYEKQLNNKNIEKDTSFLININNYIDNLLAQVAQEVLTEVVNI